MPSRTLRKTRYILVVLVFLLAAVFTCGVLAAHLQLSWLALLFLILSVLLAAAALGLRSCLDSQVGLQEHDTPNLAAITCLARAPAPYKAGTAPAGNEQDQACLPPASSEPRAAGGAGVGGVP